MLSIHLLFLCVENVLDGFFPMLSQKRLVESSLKTTTVIPKTGSNKTTIHTKMYFSCVDYLALLRTRELVSKKTDYLRISDVKRKKKKKTM